MGNLSTANSGFSTGATDTWTTQVNNVSLHDAAHVNGLASAVLQIEAVLGSGSSLPGSLSTLAARLAVQVGSDGIIIPVGAGMDFFGASAPTGWLFRDGSAVSRTTYSALFSVCGTTYGTGDGSTTFNLPDEQHRVTVGAGTGARDGESGSGLISGGTALSAKSIGQWGGSSTVALVTGNMPAHTHSVSSLSNGSAGSNPTLLNANATAAQFTSTESAGSGTAHENEMCYLVCNKIIKF